MRKRKRIKIIPMLILIVIIISIIWSVYLFLNIRLKNIFIFGNNYINDDYIINIANIKDYPKAIFINKYKIKKDLEKSPYINSVNIKYNLYSIEIKINENRPLFYSLYDKKYILLNNNTIDKLDYNINVPRLINYVPKEKMISLVNNISEVKKNILYKISDIEYRPNDIDKERFLLYMNDGNSVYITLTKLKKINYYDEVIAQLDGHKGILYLDNGNHFKVMQ